MAKTDDRFIITYKQNSLNSCFKVIVDRETGINYLFAQNGYGGGLTPLLKRDGSPVITSVNTLDEE